MMQHYIKKKIVVYCFPFLQWYSVLTKEFKQALFQPMQQAHGSQTECVSHHTPQLVHAVKHEIEQITCNIIIKGISPKMCILCVRVKINKRLFEPFCVWILLSISLRFTSVIYFFKHNTALFCFINNHHYDSCEEVSLTQSIELCCAFGFKITG